MKEAQIVPWEAREDKPYFILKIFFPIPLVPRIIFSPFSSFKIIWPIDFFFFPFPDKSLML